MQEGRDSIANALELRLSSTNPLIRSYKYVCQGRRKKRFIVQKLGYNYENYVVIILIPIFNVLKSGLGSIVVNSAWNNPKLALIQPLIFFYLTPLHLSCQPYWSGACANTMSFWLYISFDMLFDFDFCFGMGKWFRTYTNINIYAKIMTYTPQSLKHFST